jgi:hypothetical protein
VDHFHPSPFGPPSPPGAGRLIKPLRRWIMPRTTTLALCIATTPRTRCGTRSRPALGELPITGPGVVIPFLTSAVLGRMVGKSTEDGAEAARVQ